MTAQLDLIDYIATPQNWRHSDPPTSKAAGISTDKFRADHHAAIIAVLRRAGQPLAAEQISDAMGYAFASGKSAICLDYVAVGKRSSELIEAGLIERTSETHQNRSGRHAFKLRIKSQLCQAASANGSPLE